MRKLWQHEFPGTFQGQWAVRAAGEHQATCTFQRTYPGVGRQERAEGSWPLVSTWAWIPVTASGLPTGFGVLSGGSTRSPASVTLSPGSSTAAEMFSIRGNPAETKLISQWPGEGRVCSLIYGTPSAPCLPAARPGSGHLWAPHRPPVQATTLPTLLHCPGPCTRPSRSH